MKLINKIAVLQNVEILVTKATEDRLSALSVHVYILTSRRASYKSINGSFYFDVDLKLLD